MAYNFFGYFLSAVMMVGVVLVGWFVFQFRQERKLIARHGRNRAKE
jgi:hypothetical protein